MTNNFDHIKITKYLWKHDAYRYVLGTLGNAPLIFIGLNPSSATPKNPDCTYCRLNKILKNNKEFDSVILLNLYPLVATDSNDLPKELNEFHHKKNLACIKKVFKECSKSNKKLNILLAWGSGIKKRKYFKDILKELRKILSKYESNCDFYYIESKNIKYPLHPLVLPKNTKLEPKSFPIVYFS